MNFINENDNINEMNTWIKMIFMTKINNIN